MNEFVNELANVLLRTTMFLTISALIVQGILWAIRPRSPLIHRVAWSFVLLQGLLVAQWSFDIPWHEADEVSSADDASLDSLSLAASPEVSSAGGRIAPGDYQRSGWLVPSAVSPNSSRPSFSVARISGGLWFAGMLIVLSCTAGSYVVFLRRVSTAHAPREQWQKQWQRLLDEQGIETAISLRVHQTLGPLLCRLPSGYCVIVPQRIWDGFSESQRVTILRHELAHYQRGDVWKSLIARVLALPHWFNPCAWWAVRKFEETGEWACDQRIGDADPRQVPIFARALLAIIDPQSRNVCASAARGAPLAVRLRRLLAFQVPEDTVMKRCMVLVVLLGLGAAGLVRFNLVAQDRDEPEDREERTELIYDEAINKFASQLDTADSGLLAQLKTALATKAGRIVIQDRASHHEEEQRDAARTAAIPGYLAEHFVKQGDVLTLKPRQADYRKQLLKDVAVFNEDIAKIKPVMQHIANQMATNSEIEKLAARFLAHDAAPTFIYVEELRKRLRPDEYVVQEVLGELFVADSTGKFVVRAGRRPEAERFMERGLSMIKAMKRVSIELREYASELSTPDDLHQELKKAMTTQAFTAFIASEMFEGDDRGGVDERLERFFVGLDHAFKETSEGLEIVDDQRGELEEVFGKFKHIRITAEQMAGPVKSFAAKIRPGEQLEDGWRDLLQSELAQMFLAKEVGGESINAEDVIHDILGEVLEKGGDGKYHITKDDPEEIEGFIQEAFRMYRTVRRRGRMFDEAAAGLEDEQLREAFSTIGGRCVVVQSIQRSVQDEQFDGLAVWIENTFETSDNGLTLRDGAEEVIADILHDVKQVNKELANDDF